MRFPRFLSHASLAAPFVLAAVVFAPHLASASPSPSPSRALAYAKKTECVACAADIMARDFGDFTFYWNGARGRNANTFPSRCERAANCDVDTTPAVGSVMYEPVGRWGHVAVVRQVYTDGSFKVEECNYVRGRKTTRVLSYRRGLKFLHPKAPETIVVANTGRDTVMVASAVLVSDMSDPMVQEFVPVERLEVPAPEPMPVPPVIETPVEPPRGRKVSCTLTAYYQPLRGQSRYVKSYAWDVRMNGDAITASGTHVHEGTLAAPKDISFGSEVEIPGLGSYTVEDRGGAIVRQGSSYRFDLWMGSGDAGRIAAMKFGKKRNQTCIIRES
jgi:surface antigen/3D (Asp-Asp-Asp) domain-containing protein